MMFTANIVRSFLKKGSVGDRIVHPMMFCRRLSGRGPIDKARPFLVQAWTLCFSVVVEKSRLGRWRSTGHLVP